MRTLTLRNSEEKTIFTVVTRAIVVAITALAGALIGITLLGVTIYQIAQFMGG